MSYVGYSPHTRLHLLRAWHHYEVRCLKAHRKLLRHSAYLPHKIATQFYGDPEKARTYVSLNMNEFNASQFCI